MVKEFVGELLTPDREPARVITWDASWAWLHGMLGPLGRLRIRDPGLLEEYEQVIAALHAANVRRNEVLHSHWQGAVPFTGQTQYERLRLRGKGKGGPRVESAVFTEDDMYAAWQEITGATQLAVELFTRLEDLELVYPAGLDSLTVPEYVAVVKGTERKASTDNVSTE